MESCLAYHIIEHIEESQISKIADLASKILQTGVSKSCIVSNQNYVYYVSTDKDRFLSVLRKKSIGSLKVNDVCAILNKNIVYDDCVEFIVEFGPIRDACFFNMSSHDVYHNETVIIWSLIYVLTTENKLRLELVAQVSSSKCNTYIGNFVLPPIYSCYSILTNTGSNDYIFRYYDFIGNMQSIDDVRNAFIYKPSENIRARLVSYVL